MLVSSLIGNVPINNRVLEMSPETDGEEFVELRRRWDRLHTPRVALNVAGLGLLCAGALSPGANHPSAQRDRIPSPPRGVVRKLGRTR